MTTPVSIQKHLSSSEFESVSQKVKDSIITLLQADTTALYPDAKRIIEHHIRQNIPFCILSNLSADYKDNINKLIITPYEAYHDKLFTVLYSCDIGHQKPEREAYDNARDFLHAQGSDHITMIGDNPKYDYLRPKELWLQAKWINRKNITHNYLHEEVITSFDELE